jgi:hypothetical protein
MTDKATNLNLEPKPLQLDQRKNTLLTMSQATEIRVETTVSGMGKSQMVMTAMQSNPKVKKDGRTGIVTIPEMRRKGN